MPQLTHISHTMMMFRAYGKLRHGCLTFNLPTVSGFEQAPGP